MKAGMMARELTTQMIFEHGARNHADREVATFDGQTFARNRYREIEVRVRKLAKALVSSGVCPNERVATYCWNHQAHLEAYFAVPSIGAVLHTLNVRLAAEQIRFVMEQAEDRVLLLDSCLAHQIRELLPEIPSLEHVILVGGEADLGSFSGTVSLYETLIDAHEPLAEWPSIQEDSAAAICYTSGTTGNPKGVVYSHRSIYLHSLASMAADTFGICERDVILLMPPMFHSNAWGLPYSGWLAGSGFVLPAQHLQADKVRTMIEAERPTVTATVPTILNDLLGAHAVAPIDMSSFRVIFSGGSAVSPQLIERVWQTWRVAITQGWGMTETSPMCTLSHPPAASSPEDESVWRSKSGRAVPGMEVRIVDEQGVPLPRDGKAVGNLELRGPWVASGYYRSEDTHLSADGWLKTGDAGVIDAQGYVQITDRIKDLIKSGGEWISSVELENLVSAHPNVIEVAVVAVPDARWEERPLVVFVPRDPAVTAFDEMRSWLAPQVAGFWVPEYWSAVPTLPRTSVNKIDKRRLRSDVEAGSIPFHRSDSKSMV